MNRIVSKTQYTFNASTSEITLLSPWKHLTEANITKIQNLTRGETIYDSRSPDHGIDVTAAVITYEYDNSRHEDTDEFRIEVDAIPIVEEAPQTNVALTVSGGATPSDTSDVIIVQGAQEITIQIENGNSTDLDAFVYVSYKKDGQFTTTPYASVNLGANDIDQIPLAPGIYGLKIKVVNEDAVNATVVSTGVIAVGR